MGLCGTFRLTLGTRDLKYIIGTVPQESGRVVTLSVREIRYDCLTTRRISSSKARIFLSLLSYISMI